MKGGGRAQGGAGGGRWGWEDGGEAVESVEGFEDVVAKEEERSGFWWEIVSKSFVLRHFDSTHRASGGARRERGGARGGVRRRWRSGWSGKRCKSQRGGRR